MTVKSPGAHTYTVTPQKSASVKLLLHKLVARISLDAAALFLAIWKGTGTGATSKCIRTFCYPLLQALARLLRDAAAKRLG